MKIYTRTLQLLSLSCILVVIFTACGGNRNATSFRATPTTQQFLNTPVTYVALGASDAVGVGSNQPGSQGYVPLLAARLPAGSHLINLGISGIRLHEALTQELPLALDTNPNLITIWLVTNDFIDGVPYDDYMRDLNHLLQQLQIGTHATIFIANLPDLSRLPLFKGQSAEKKGRMVAEIQRWNTAIASIAGHYGVTLVDLFSHQSQLTNHPEYISNDGFHPSPAGYVQISNYFWNAINMHPTKK